MGVVSKKSEKGSGQLLVVKAKIGSYCQSRRKVMHGAAFSESSGDPSLLASVASTTQPPAHLTISMVENEHDILDPSQRTIACLATNFVKL